MAKFFPMMTDLRGENVIIVGSFEKGKEKAERLRAFGADVTFVDTPVTDTDVIVGKYPAAVVVADASLVDVEHLFAECKRARIPMNTVDFPEACSFIFPSMSVTKHLTVAVSTDGACPAAAVKIRKMVEDTIPSEIDDILEWLQTVRRELKNMDMPSALRQRAVQNLTAMAFSLNRPLSSEETDLIINGIC